MLKSKSRSFADAKLTLQKYACERKMLLVSNDLMLLFQVFALFNNIAYVIGTYFLYLDWKSNPAGTNAPQPPTV